MASVLECIFITKLCQGFEPWQS